MHLFFDLDNTLWDFDASAHCTLSALYAENGLQQKLNADFDSFYDKYRSVNDVLWNQYYVQKIEKKELRTRRFTDTFLFFGYEDQELSHVFAEEYLKRAPYSKELKPGCTEMLNEMRKKHELHIITNGFAEVQHVKLDNCGLRSYFSQIIISEEHGLTKPQVEIFRLAERLAGAGSAECVMIGDNPVSDIDGAVGAGWKAIHYDHDQSGATHPKAVSISHLSELCGMF